MSLQENVDCFFGKLENLINTKTVFGEPITVGDTTIIPVVDISFGVGTGSRSGEKQDAGGGGAGARMTASAVIVVRSDSVQVMQIKKSTYLENLIDMVPDLINKLTKKESPAVSPVVSEEAEEK